MADEVTPESITDWAINYASFEELELVAKALYSLYAQQRKTDYPELHKANKKAKRFHKKKRYNKVYEDRPSR